MGMHWGERNGPPYPLTSWQKKAGDAVAKGKVVLSRTLNDYTKKAKAKAGEYAQKAKTAAEAKIAKEKAKREDMANRKKEADRREKLVALAKKHPELLTDKELDELNNRKNKENNFERNYNLKKKESEAVKQIKSSLVRDVVTPTAVELGKAAVASLVAGGDFEKIARERVTKAVFGNSSGNQNQANKNNQSNNKKQPKKKKISVHGSGEKK